MDESFQAIQEYIEMARTLGIDSKDVVITATEASRVAKNSQEFYTKLVQELDISVSIITGEAEAHYTALGVCQMAKVTKPISIIDIGGASTEIIQVNPTPFRITKSISLPMGSVRASEWIAKDCLEVELNRIWDEKMIFDASCEEAIFVAGTMTSLGAMIKGMLKFDAAELVDQKIDFKHFDSFISKIKSLSPEELNSHYPFLGKRAKTIVAGALVATFIGQKLKLSTILVSPFGLRYGTCLVPKIEDRYVEQRIG